MARDALIVIDPQVGLLEGAYRVDETLTALAEALRRAREAKALVIFLRHNHATFAPLMAGSPTCEIHSMVSPEPHEVIIDKTASDGFWETNLQRCLDEAGVRCVVIGGLQTEFCVDATCRAALSKGYDVTLIADGHTTGDAVTDAATTIRHHNYALTHLAHPRQRVIATRAEELVFE